MAKLRSILAVLTVTVIFAEVAVVYISQVKLCGAPFLPLFSRDSGSVAEGNSELSRKKLSHWNSSELHHQRKSSQREGNGPPAVGAIFSKEPKYTIRFQRDVPEDYSELFATDSEGNCVGIACKWSKIQGVPRELIASAPELFRKVPLTFLENFKNPCWLRGKTELNCLPYFYIIGMYKSGTYDIWTKIRAHPDVIDDLPKEPHWWGMRRFGDTYIPCNKKEVLRARTLTGGKDDSSLEWYLNLYKFSAVPEIINTTVTTKEGMHYHPKVFGEASVTTMNGLAFNWTDLIEPYPYTASPPYTNADLFRALQPNAKFILMIRNPTRRADSFFWYTNDYKEPCPKGKDFADRWHSYATNYIACFNKCIKEHNLRYCAYAADCPYDVIPDLQVGIYYVYIRDWLKLFTRDQFKVIRLEDWEAEPAKVYRDLIKFLDLRPLTANEEANILNIRRVNVNRIKHPKTRPETWRILNDFYRPYNKELAKLMGDEKYNYPDYYG